VLTAPRAADKRDRLSSAWPYITATAATGSPAKPTSSSRAICRFTPPTREPTASSAGASTKPLLLGTLYAALRPTRSIRYNTDLILDVESSGGRGLSEAIGTGRLHQSGRVRNPTLGPKPYLARYGIHQVIGLDAADRQPGSQAPLRWPPACRCAAFEFRIGKMTLPDFFDVNGPGSDSHLQFMNWTVDNNGAWDYAADTRGYTVGAMAEYDDKLWSVPLRPLRHAHGGKRHRHGLGLQPRPRPERRVRVASQLCSAAQRHATPLVLRQPRAHGHVTARRSMLISLESDKTPNILLHEHFGALKYGFGYNAEQEITENLRVFGRFGWNEGQHESFAYTEVDQTVEAGADYAGSRWHRPVDKIGVAVVSNAIKRDHQELSERWRPGFPAGRRHAQLRPRDIVESYYNWHAWRGLFYALDVQHIANPGYNRDRGPAWVGSVRAHVDFLNRDRKVSRGKNRSLPPIKKSRLCATTLTAWDPASKPSSSALWMGNDLFVGEPAKVGRHMPVAHQSDIISKAHGPAYRGIDAKLRHAAGDDQLVDLARFQLSRSAWSQKTNRRTTCE